MRRVDIFLRSLLRGEASCRSGDAETDLNSFGLQFENRLAHSCFKRHSGPVSFKPYRDSGLIRLHCADAGLILERVFTWIAVWRSSRGMK